MTAKKNDKPNKASDAGDTDASLQNELSRETAEGADSVGDVGSNRTLSGSSSWETLPDKADAGGSTTKSGKEAGKPSGAPGRGKK
jgi:hypothetical protein